MHIRIIAAIIIVFFLTNATYAVEDKAQQQGTITVMGEAHVKVPPDQATIPITVVTENETLAKAKEENDKKLKKVTEIATRYGAKAEDMQSTFNSVEPEYDYNAQTPVQTMTSVGEVNFNIDATSLSADKLKKLSEEFQKEGFDNIRIYHAQQHTTYIGAHARMTDPNEDMAREALKKKEDDLEKLTKSMGIGRDKVQVNDSFGETTEVGTSPRQRRITKYKASAVVDVVLHNKDKVVGFINDVIAAGIDNIGSVTFGLTDENALKEEASLKALQDAKEKAGKLADAVGMAIDRPVTINVGGSQVIPLQRYYPRMKAMNQTVDAEAAASPVSQDALPSGMIEIEQTVNVTFWLKQK